MCMIAIYDGNGKVRRLVVLLFKNLALKK